MVFRNRSKLILGVCVGEHSVSQEIGKIMYK